MRLHSVILKTGLDPEVVDGCKVVLSQTESLLMTLEAEGCGGNSAVGKKRTTKPPVRKKKHAKGAREPSVDSISSSVTTNSKPLVVYTRRKKGLRNLHAAKDNFESADAQDVEPLFDEAALIKRTKDLRPHRRRKEKHQKSGITDEEDNDSSSSLVECESKEKRKLEVVRNSSQASSLTDDQCCGHVWFKTRKAQFPVC